MIDDFPPHTGSMILQHNAHREEFITVRDLIAGDPGDYVASRFKSADDQQYCIELDEIWTLRWYPEGPAPQQIAHASSLPVLLEFAARIASDFGPGGWPN